MSKVHNTLVKQGKRSFVMSAIGSDTQTMAWKNGEFYELRLLKEIARRKLKGTYVDVGANFGNHSVFFANFCPASLVVAVEPFPETRKVLEANLKRHVPKYALLPYAAGDKAEMVSMHLMKGGKLGSARIKAHGEGDIEVKTLDDLLRGIPHVAVVKIDVEGNEIATIAGAVNTIKMFRPLIIAECFRRSDDAGDDFAAISALLKPFGYKSDGKNWCKSRTCIWEP